MATFELVEAAFHAVEYDGQHLDLNLLAEDERAIWDWIQRRDEAIRALLSDCEYEAAHALQTSRPVST